MKSLALVLVSVVAASVLSSCGGECACNSYNRDYLRDVPTTRTQRF